MDMDRAALLRQPRHFHHARTLAVDLRGLRQHRADGHDAGSADAGYDDVVGAADRGQRGRRKIRHVERLGPGLAQPAALDGNEAGAEPLETGVILVATGLVDLPLAAQFGIKRHDRDTIRLHRAIAATFADFGVDPDAPVGVGELSLLAAAALFGGAGLDIEDRTDAAGIFQLALDVHHLGAFLKAHPLGKALAVHVFLFVIDHNDRIDAHRHQFPRDLGRGQIALVGLTAGHRDGVVIEDLVGDIGARGDRRTDRQNSRMIIGSVAKVLKDMAARAERGLADPVDPLAAHMGEAGRFTAHPLHHVVTADPGIGAASLGQLRGRIMRTTRTEPGRSGRNLRCVIIAAHLGQPFQSGLDMFGPAPLFDQDSADLLRDHHRIQRIACRKQFLVGSVVLPSMHPPAVAVVEDGLFQLHLDQLALFLDADDEIQVLGPFLHGLHVQRPGLPDLVSGQAQPFGLGLVDTQQRQRMDQIQPVLAGGDKADLGTGFAPMLAVDAVGTGKRLGRPTLVIDHPRFLRHRRVAQADVQPALGHDEIRAHEIQPMRIAVHDRGGLDRVLHRLQAGPDAGETRQRETIKPEIKDFLHPRRRQNRDIGVDHGPIRLVQHGRAFAGMVVTHRHDHAAMSRRTRHVRVPHHVAAAIHARPLAVPQREHAVMLALAAQFGLLAAPDCRGGKIFVQSRLKQHAGFRQALALAHHLQVHTAQGRAAIAGHIARRIQTRRLVACRLHQHQPNQGLGSVQQNVGLRQIEAVGQREFLLAHPASPPCVMALGGIIGQNC